MSCGIDRLRLFDESFSPAADQRDPELEETLRKQSGPRESAGEPQYQELLRLLDEEFAYVQEEFEYAEKVNEEKAAVERDAALAPAGEVWTTMVRQQAALDRSIDRKVRILLALRKEFTKYALPVPSADQEDDPEMKEINQLLGIDIPSKAPGTEEQVTSKTERTGNLYENKGPLWKTPSQGWKAHENK